MVEEMRLGAIGMDAGMRLGPAPGAGGGASLLAINRALLNNGDGLVLDFLSDTAYVKDSGTPANDYYDRTRDLLTVTNTLKMVTGPDGNLRYQAHNLLSNSGDFTSAVWNYGSSATTRIADQAAAPDGTLSADQLDFPASGNRYLYQSAASVGPAKFSIWLKVASGSHTIALRTWATGATERTTAVVTTEWQKFTLTTTQAEPTAFGLDNRAAYGADDVAVTMYAWRAEAREANSDGEYVATSGTAKYELPLDHDATTLDSSATSVNVGTGKRTFALDGSTDFRTATTAWADATSYAIGDQRQVSNRSYTCIAPHTSSTSNKPSGEGNASWKRDEKTLRISDQSDVDGKYLIARVDYQIGTTLAVDVLRIVGSGSASLWHVIECKGVLIEEARTNLATQSSVLDSVSWSKTRASITANAAIAPDGTMAADKFVEDGTASNNHYISCSATVSSTTTYTFSVYAKTGGRDWLWVGGGSIAFDNSGTFFDVSAGVVGTSIGRASNAKIEDVGNGWFRCSTTVVADDTTGSMLLALASNDGAAFPIYSGDGSSGVYVWGAQLEEGSFPTSHIPTAGSTVTRAADVISLATSDFAFSATEGTISCSWASKTPTSQHMAVEIANPSDRSAGLIEMRTSVTARALAVRSSGFSTEAQFTVGQTADAFINAVMAYKADDFAASFETAPSIQTDLSGAVTLSGVTTMGIGGQSDAGSHLNGHLRKLIYTPTRESNAALQARAA